MKHALIKFHSCETSGIRIQPKLKLIFLFDTNENLQREMFLIITRCVAYYTGIENFHN